MSADMFKVNDKTKIYLLDFSQQTFTCSKSTVETLEKEVKYDRS